MYISSFSQAKTIFYDISNRHLQLFFGIQAMFLLTFFEGRHASTATATIHTDIIIKVLGKVSKFFKVF